MLLNCASAIYVASVLEGAQNYFTRRIFIYVKATGRDLAMCEPQCMKFLDSIDRLRHKPVDA